MNHIIENATEILDHYVGGFRQYILQEPVRSEFVSRNLCDLTGYEKEDFEGASDAFACIVHLSDQPIYQQLLTRLKQREQTIAAQYRIRKKDGTVIYVNDAATSRRLDDGRLVGYSVLTDITPIKTENNNLRFLNETVPCGFLKYTCDKNPRVTYINEQMIKMLRFPEVKDGESDYLELYKENIYLNVPMEERRRFARYLERVYAQGVPVAGTMTLLRCDGSKAYVFGWVTKCVNEAGEEEFQSVCMDITEKYHLKREKETQRYLKALTEVYDKIFEYDYSNHTVKCLYGKNSPMFKWLENVPMQLEEATKGWIEQLVVEKDRARVKAFVDEHVAKNNREADTPPRQIEYEAFSSNGKIKTYTSLFLKIDATTSLFCCRRKVGAESSERLRKENDALKNANENMQGLVMHFTDGIAAFEVVDDSVVPLYINDNVCEFFGIEKEEWLQMMKKKTSIRTFVARSGLAYEEIEALLENGEAEFTYYDLSTNTEKQVKAVCSQKFSEGASSRYVMLYKVDEEERREEGECVGNKVEIRTFGYFDVFVNGKPIAFRNEKSKELFALLVDRRGGFVTSEEAIGFLWEDEPSSTVLSARYRKVALRLKNILEEYGIADIVETVGGKRRIVSERVHCDLYDYLSGKEEYEQLFKGSYLTNYSWAEVTLGELLNK